MYTITVSVNSYNGVTSYYYQQYRNFLNKMYQLIINHPVFTSTSIKQAFNTQLPKPLLFLQFDCRFLLISCTCSNNFHLLLQYFSYGKNLNDTSKETRRRMTYCCLHCILNICNTQIPPIYGKLVLTFVNVDMLPCCLVLLQIFQKVGVVSKQL